MWPFSKKQKPPASGSGVLFKAGSNEAFFEMQCKFGFSEVKIGKGVAAIVLDAVKEFGAPVAIKTEDDGTQLAMIKVASDQGGFVIPAKTPDLPPSERSKS